MSNPQAQFHHTWEIRVPWPIEECFGPRFLLNFKDRLQTGAQVNFVRYSNDRFQEFIEVCVGLRVVTSTKEGVELFRPSWARIEGPNGDAKAERDIVVARGDRGKFKVRIDGDTHKEFATALEADEYAVHLSEEMGKPALFYTRKMRELHGQQVAA